MAVSSGPSHLRILPHHVNRRCLLCYRLVPIPLFSAIASQGDEAHFTSRVEVDVVGLTPPGSAPLTTSDLAFASSVHPHEGPLLVRLTDAAQPSTGPLRVQACVCAVY